MKNILRLFIVGMILCFSINSVQAITIVATPPTTGNSTIDADIASALTNAVTQANSDIAKYNDQSELAKGFANANAFAAQAATQQGFQDYSIFAVTTGVMGSIKGSDYEKIDNKVKDDGDVDAGVGASLAWVNVGINAGFIYPGLYLNVKYGQISETIEDVDFKTRIFGLGANYTWIQSVSVLGGLAKWRGVSFGTGFIYNMNETHFNIEVDEITRTLSSYGSGTALGTLVLDPSLNIGIKTETYTIPFDVTTSIQFLWVMNFNLGAGIDFTFGESNITFDSNGSITLSDYPASTPGSFTVEGGTKAKPTFVHARLTTGLGFNFGPAKIDIPVIWYPLDDAVAVGITAGIIW